MSDKISHPLLARIYTRMREINLGRADFNRAMSQGGQGTFLNDLERGKARSPGIEKVALAAKTLKTTIGWLATGEDSTPRTLSISGVMKGNEMWEVLSRKETKTADLSFLDHNLAVVAIESDDMQPTYRRGDILAGTRALGRNMDNLIGCDCIVETAAGERYIKILHRGSVRGAYTLRSLDPRIQDEENVRLAWAAPIQMILRDL